MAGARASETPTAPSGERWQTGAMRKYAVGLAFLLVASSCTAEDFGLHVNPCPQGDSWADRQEINRLREEQGINCVRNGGTDRSSSTDSEPASGTSTSKKLQPQATTSSTLPKATVTSGVGSSPAESTYTFGPDDTLWSLAEDILGSGSRWPEIAQLNQIDDPSAIPNGTVIRIPSGKSGQVNSTTSTNLSPGSATSCSSDSYRNVDGQCVRRPTINPGSSYTARCRDGTFSHSKSRQGTCSHHGGVSSWG